MGRDKLFSDAEVVHILDVLLLIDSEKMPSKI